MTPMNEEASNPNANAERFVVDNIKPLLEILRDKVDAKDTTIIAMFSELIRAAEDAVKEVEEMFRGKEIFGEELAKLQWENYELHWKLGHKPFCDKHKHEIMYSEGMGFICQDCENERKEKNNEETLENSIPQECPSWHWEEEKKRYFVLGIKDVPIDANDVGIIDEQDNPLLSWSLDGAKRVKEAYDKKWADEFPEGVATIVELKEVK